MIDTEKKPIGLFRIFIRVRVMTATITCSAKPRTMFCLNPFPPELCRFWFVMPTCTAGLGVSSPLHQEPAAALRICVHLRTPCSTSTRDPKCVVLCHLWSLRYAFPGVPLSYVVYVLLPSTAMTTGPPRLKPPSAWDHSMPAHKPLIPSRFSALAWAQKEK
jgi:hypothetical protein